MESRRHDRAISSSARDLSLFLDLNICWHQIGGPFLDDIRLLRFPHPLLQSSGAENAQCDQKRRTYQQLPSLRLCPHRSYHRAVSVGRPYRRHQAVSPLRDSLDERWIPPLVFKYAPQLMDRTLEHVVADKSAGPDHLQHAFLGDGLAWVLGEAHQDLHYLWLKMYGRAVAGDSVEIRFDAPGTYLEVSIHGNYPRKRRNYKPICAIFGWFPPAHLQASPKLHNFLTTSTHHCGRNQTRSTFPR